MMIIWSLEQSSKIVKKNHPVDRPTEQKTGKRVHWYIGLNLSEVCSEVSNWQYVITGSGNGLAPNMSQANTFTDCLVHCIIQDTNISIPISLCGDEVWSLFDLCFATGIALLCKLLVILLRVRIFISLDLGQHFL